MFAPSCTSALQSYLAAPSQFLISDKRQMVKFFIYIQLHLGELYDQQLITQSSNVNSMTGRSTVVDCCSTNHMIFLALATLFILNH